MIEVPPGEPLHPWFMRQLQEMEPEGGEHTSLIYWGSAKQQIMFVRDTVPMAYQGRLGSGCDIQVVGEHSSKSTLLPVYAVKIADGLAVLMRGNYHDWKLSVISDEPIYMDPSGLWDPRSDYLLSEVYFEGFPAEGDKRPHVFPVYGAGGRCHFSLMLPYVDVLVWTFLFLLRRDYRG